MPTPGFIQCRKPRNIELIENFIPRPAKVDREDGDDIIPIKRVVAYASPTGTLALFRSVAWLWSTMTRKAGMSAMTVIGISSMSFSVNFL